MAIVSSKSDTEAVLRPNLPSRQPLYGPVSQRRLNFESARPQWLRECAAEATGVFFYVFPGLASVASQMIESNNATGTASVSQFQVGWAFGIGIVFAILTCAPVSGGHFNPALTLAMAIWRGFPWKKVPYYIFSQIFGAILGALVIVGVMWPQIRALNASFVAAGKPLVAGGAPASIFCAFPAVTHPSIGLIFLIEFMADIFIGIIIWAAMDPSNPFVTPVCIPFLLGMAYTDMIWGFGSIALSTNLARDLGARVVAAIFYGPEVFTYRGYPPIAIFVNVPATLLATTYYELLMRDSATLISQGHAVQRDGSPVMPLHFEQLQHTQQREPERTGSLS